MPWKVRSLNVIWYRFIYSVTVHGLCRGSIALTWQANIRTYCSASKDALLISVLEK